MELETDKAVVEVPSSVSGAVQEIRVKEGDKIKVGQVIFTVDGEAKAPAASAAGRSPSGSQPQRNTKAGSSAERDSGPGGEGARGSAVRAAAPSGVGEFKLPELGEKHSQGGRCA